MPRGLAVAAVIVVIGTLVGGCRLNPEPPPLQSASSSPSPSPTASPSAAAPTLPAKAKGTSEAAAKAFVRHWIAVLNYAGPSGDHKALRELSAERCVACSAISDFIRDVHLNGGEIAGQGWVPRRVKVVSSTAEFTVVDVWTLVQNQTVKPSAASTSEVFTGGRRLKTFWVEPHDSNWRITRLDQPR
jgi:hypothetical protein